MDRVKDELLSTLTANGQEHLLRFWDELDVAGRERLAAEIRGIDFALVRRLFQQIDVKDEIRTLADRAGSPPSFRLEDPRNTISPQSARQTGIDALRAGHLGVILVAGGQGTRLGFDHPKGMFPIGPVSGKSLFQIHIEKIMAIGRRYGVRVPLYLMTSPETHDETVAFLERNHRFGLPAEDLYFFCQGTMPAVDATNGRVLLARKDHVALSPAGHGGMLAAYHDSGAMADARRRGIRQLFYFQVDNPLVRLCDPEFVGYHLVSRSQLTTQVVRKKEPLEKVGNVVRVDDRLHVIEYSDLPDDVARKRAEDGSLVIWAGSIAVHAMELAFLERMADMADALPYHRARKKVAHFDANGRWIEPSEPNAVKFERFIFDLMPSAAGAVVVEVDPQWHFAPLKNAPGAANDTEETVKAQLSAQHRQWLHAAGFEVADNIAVEISPLFALDGEELVSRILAKRPITEPTYFG